MHESTIEADLELRRVFRAPRERVFRAWTEADALGAWFGPQGTTTRVAEFDPRPGGRYRFEMAEGGEYVVGGLFREVVPPERLVFTWRWENGAFAGVETEVRITLADVDGGTELTLVHRRLPGGDARQKHADGWTGCFDCLARHLAG